MKKFNVKNNLGIVVSDGFKKLIESAVDFTSIERNSYGRTRYDKSFVGTIITFNPNNKEVEYFSVLAFVDFNDKSDVENAINNKINSISNSENYSQNELITVIYANELEYNGCVGYVSKEEQANRDLKIENKFMSIYINIVSRANDDYIEDLDLSIRTKNCLLRAGYDTVEKVKSLSLDEICRVRNLGQNSRNELEQVLEIEFV